MSPADLNSEQKELHPSINEIGPTRPNAANFWYETINHDGQSPFIPNGATWKVFRNVATDYGADNTGRNDATKAITNAITGLPLEYFQ